MSNVIYKKDLHDVALAVAQGSKDYTDNSIEKLKWELGTYDLSVTTDSTVAYTKTIPANTIKAQLNYIGGASKVSENLIVLNDIAETTNNGITYKIENGVITLNGTATANININLILNSTVYPTGIFATFNSQANSNVSIYNLKSNGAWGSIGFGLSTVNRTYTINDNTDLYGFRLYIKADTEVSNFVIKPFYIKGTTAPTEFSVGFENIRSAKTTSVVISGTDVAPITKAIPSEIQALEGYGLGYDTTDYNVLDYKTKKYTTKCLHFVLNKTDYNWQLNSSQTVRYINDFASIIKRVATNTDTPQILCDKLTKTAWDNLYNETVSSGISISSNGNIGISISDYENLTTLDIVFLLALPRETDISQYIDDDFKNIDTTYMGTITFENEFGYDVPSEIDYLIEEVKA